MQMNRGGRLGLHQEMVSAGLGESPEITFGFDDHQMNVERLCRRTANGLQHDRPDANVRHETSVHYVDMDPVGIGRVDGAHLLSQSCEIGGQYRWCHENRLHGCYLRSGLFSGCLIDEPDELTDWIDAGSRRSAGARTERAEDRGLLVADH